MNSKLLLSAVVAMLISFGAHAQNYSIDWFTIDGGGGTSSGGPYSISGTIGQPDAGRMTGAGFSLDGGFWGFVGAVQTVGSPLLRTERVGASVRIFWPLPAAGFSLEQSGAVDGGPASWQATGIQYQTNATHISVTVPAPMGNKFYRLKK